MLLELFCNDKNSNMGKTVYTPDIDCTTIKDIVMFLRKSNRFQFVILFYYFTGWLMGPFCGLSVHGGSNCPVRNGNRNGQLNMPVNDFLSYFIISY